MSVAKHHLDHISFDALGRWELIHSINPKRDGTPCSSPYAVTSCWYLVGTKPALFVFGIAARRRSVQSATTRSSSLEPLSRTHTETPCSTREAPPVHHRRAEADGGED